MAEITLNGEKLSISRARFKTWIKLEEIREDIFKAVEIDDMEGISDSIVTYLSTALNASVDILNSLSWEEIAIAYSAVTNMNGNIRLLPFMKYFKKNIDDEREVWDYPGRLWYSYASRMAEKYAWELDYIADLDVDDAFSLIQEILVSDQIRKEWEWMLSDRSVGYDEATKKSRYIELPRPDWMKPIPKPPKKVKIPKIMLPVGNVVRYTNGQDVVH